MIEQGVVVGTLLLTIIFIVMIKLWFAPITIA